MQSLNLFGPPAQIQHRQNQSTIHKRNKLRLQIRRTFLNKTFQHCRQNLLEDLNSKTLKKLVEDSQKKGFDLSGLKEMIDILDENCEKADFMIKLSQFKIQDALVKLLMQHSQMIDTAQKYRLLSALNYLTFFADDSTENLIKNLVFVDFLRKQIEGLRVQKLEQLLQFNMIINLLMNLSSLIREDFNLYLAESDVSKNINQKIAETVNIAKHKDSDEYCQAVYQIRESLLRLYKNIVAVRSGSEELSVTIIENLLIDEIYLNDHRHRVFILLVQAMNKEKFWSSFRKSRNGYNLCIRISEAMDYIQQRCFCKDFNEDINNTLTEQEYKEFYGMICFLNQLYYQDSEDDFDWFTVIQAVFNGYMLAQFLIQSIKRKDKNEQIAALIMYVNLSREPDVTAEQLIIIRKANNPLELIKIFAGNQSMLMGIPTGIYCMKILTNLLKKNPVYLKDILALRVVDYLQNILADQNSVKQRLCECINLVQQMIASDIFLNSKQKSKIVEIFDNKGLIRRIEQFVNHSNRDIYTKAECFTEYIANKRE